MVTLVRRAAQLDILGDAGTLSLAAQLGKVWNLYATTFSGMSVISWVFGIDMLATSAFNILLIVQLAAAVVLLACRAPVDAGAALARVPHRRDGASSSSPSPRRGRSADPTISSCCGPCPRCIS